MMKSLSEDPAAQSEFTNMIMREACSLSERIQLTIHQKMRR